MAVVTSFSAIDNKFMLGRPGPFSVTWRHRARDHLL